MKKFGMFPQKTEVKTTEGPRTTVFYNGESYEKVKAKDVLSLGIHPGVISGINDTGAFINFFVTNGDEKKVATGYVHQSGIVKDDFLNPHAYFRKGQHVQANVSSFIANGNAKVDFFHFDFDENKPFEKRVATSVVIQKDSDVAPKPAETQQESAELHEQMKQMEKAQAQKLAEIQAEQAEKFAAMEKGMQQILQEKVTKVEIEASYAQREALELKEKIKQMEADMQRKLEERTALMEAEFEAKMKAKEEADRQQAIETRVQELKSRMEKIVRVVSPKAEKFIREMLTEGYNSIEIGEAFLRTAASFDPSLQFALSMESDLRRSLRGE